MRLDTERRARILDFDVECRPLAWYGGDFVTKQPTGIAWKFVGERGKIEVAVIGESDRMSRVLDEERAMLEAFCAAYEKADLVTGHYVRGFDLPVLNGALMRLGMPLLGAKDVQDTKSDLVRAQGISKSLENLGAMFELKHPKIPMNTGSWAAANMLLPHGIAATRKRVVGDVREHVELRQHMLDAGYLSPARAWHPGGSRMPEYTP